jgi:exonuclease VII large subunit
MSLFPSARVYSVSELTAEVKDRLEGEFSGIMVEGEISNHGSWLGTLFCSQGQPLAEMCLFSSQS